MKKLLKPINDNILIKRLQPIREGLIIIPDQTFQQSFYGIILDVGHKVKDKTLRKDIIIFVTPTAKDNKLLHDNVWLVKEKDIIAVRYQGVVRPFGNRVFLKRLNQETMINGIVIPDCHESADQSLEGIFILCGVKDNQIITVPFDPGVTVKVQKWDMSTVEIDVDGEYYLSVKQSLLEYVKHD